MKSKGKLRRLFLALVLLYANIFPSSGLIVEYKTIEELEEDDEIHLGI